MTNPQQTEGLTAEQHIIHDALDDLYYGKCAGERLEVCYDAVSNFIKASRQDQSSLIKVLTEALEEFSREYDGFEDGMGEPCPTLAKARSALSMAKEGTDGRTYQIECRTFVRRFFRQRECSRYWLGTRFQLRCRAMA